MRRLLLAGAVLIVAAVGSGIAQGAQETRTPTQVVRAWSHALNTNDNVGAARLFAYNAHVVQPGVDAILFSARLARIFNEGLPCGGEITRLQVSKRAIVATFRLHERPKHRCDAPGTLAAALFVVQKGRIVLWEQVAVPKQSGPTA
jgi:limonene-1,2-epoxide hydrolase